MRFTVRVYPNSRVSVAGGRYGDTEPPVLVVRFDAPAVEGKANDAVVAVLADALGLKRGQVRIVSGERGRTKVVEVEGADPAALARLNAEPVRPGSA